MTLSEDFKKAADLEAQTPITGGGGLVRGRIILTPVTLEEALAGLPDGRYLADDLEIFSGLRVNDGVVTDEVTFSRNNFEGWLRQYGYDNEPQNLRIYRVEQNHESE